MKRTVATLIMLFAATGVFAQIFVGGSVGFNVTGGKTESGNTSTDKVTQTSFSLTPKAGIFLSEKLAVGTMLGFNLQSEKTPGTPEEIDRTITFGLTPFARYYAFSLNKLTVFAQGNLGFSYGVEKNKVGSATTTGPKTTTIGISAFPGISYKLTDKVELEAVISGINFTLNRVSVKHNNTKDITNTFGVGANLDAIATTIGAIVKF
ncbi:MAG TPA: hypothetical protein ENN49_10620 [Bacteroidales bacterium]|nr:hypothetical protein [Bacteroidales bacterium]